MKGEIKREIEDVIKSDNLTLIKSILFGSRAKGDYTEESDWDILIVLKEQTNPIERKNIWRKLYKALHKKFPKHSFDIFIKSEQEFESEKSIANTIANEAMEEGEIL